MPSWQHHLSRNPSGFHLLDPSVTHGVPVRLFLTEALLAAAEEGLYQQILNACAFPGVCAVAITPDVHFGYGVPVGCVIATDGTLAMGPVGFDIGCGMMAARSTVDVGAARRRDLRASQAAGRILHSAPAELADLSSSPSPPSADPLRHERADVPPGHSLHLAHGSGVPSQLRVAGDEGDALAEGLGKQQTVKGIFVQGR
jgi:hypothetical protein